MALEQFAGWVFGPITNNLSPFVSVLVLSFIVSLISMGAHKLMTNQALLKQMKDEMKVLQEQMKKSRDNPQKAMALQKELMQKNLHVMKQGFKPLLVSLLPVILVLGVLSRTYKDAGDILQWGVSLPLLGAGFGWFGAYILFSLVFTIVLKKVLRVH